MDLPSTFFKNRQNGLVEDVSPLTFSSANITDLTPSLVLHVNTARRYDVVNI
jgi:hypothetical protein